MRLLEGGIGITKGSKEEFADINPNPRNLCKKWSWSSDKDRREGLRNAAQEACTNPPKKPSSKA